MPLGTEVGLGPGDIVLNRDPALPKGAQPCVIWGPSPPKTRGTAPNFRPMSVAAKRLDGSRFHLVRR